MDVCVETEATGSHVRYQAGFYPTVTHPVLADRTTLPPVPDPGKSGRMPELLKAVAILRGEVGDDVLVTGCVVGPMTLTTQLLGMEKALYLAADAPEAFERILDYATAVVRTFGRAQIDAGAHLALVFDPSASPEVVPPQFFREFLLPRLTQLGTAFTAAGALANWLHIAGRTEAILPSYSQAGFAIANFDYCVSPTAAMAALPHTCLDGNIKPVAFVEAAPEEIAATSRVLLDAFAHRGGFILSSGCEIPPEARPENVAAMVTAVRACRP
jgi:uroporphyrinogen decarboxylase